MSGKPLEIPELALVVLIGPSGAGKSTFAARHFRATEVLSSDFFRGLVANDENDQSATGDAFDALRYVAAKRLKNGLLTVADATNVRSEDRKTYVELARQYHLFAVALVLNVPERVCLERNAQRPDRTFGPHVVRQHCMNVRRSLDHLEREGFRYVHILSSLEQIETAEIVRKPLWNNKRSEHGPFDIIGDVHGCADELEELLGRLGYTPQPVGENHPFWGNCVWSHPEGRSAVFVGDLVDRGPRVIDTLRLVRNMVRAGHGFCVVGNHDVKLSRALSGRDVKLTHGLDRSMAEFDGLPEEVRELGRREVRQFIDGLVSHYVFDDGKLVVAHAGIREEMQGRSSGAVREFCLYGETTGETDEFGLPVRLNWAKDYRGPATVVYGHTPMAEVAWLNHTANIDTGCVFGGKLTALRYPEKTIESVAARREYTPPSRPFLPEPGALTAQQEHDDLLDLQDVLGKRLIETSDRGRITIREENAIAALEVISRFAVDPRWLIYLPPTMSPSETSQRPELLEHPDEALAYFTKAGVERVVCEEKHMGSRAVVVICRDVEAARKRFGVVEERMGVCYTRTGRPFFSDEALETAFLDRVRQACDRAGIWQRLDTDWVCLDTELMPWSVKAQELLRRQYAAVGAAAGHSLRESVRSLDLATARGVDLGELSAHTSRRQEMIERYRLAYGHYCWPVKSVTDLKLAPFHIMASEGQVHTGRSHLWHLEELHRLETADPDLIVATRFRTVNLAEPLEREAAVQWWEELTASGGEGMVVKPESFVHQGERGFTQPAVKCRGREYLRIIYGPEYTAPDQMSRLRSRGLSAKRSLAIREFSLGVEALRRFVAKEPLRRVHECVFGVLALESEPVDPRL